MWNGIYATDVHFLLARLPNPITRGHGWAALSLGLARGVLQGVKSRPNPGPAALNPRPDRQAAQVCILPVQQGSKEQRGSCSDTLLSQQGYPLEILLQKYTGQPILRSTRSPAFSTMLTSMAFHPPLWPWQPPQSSFLPKVRTPLEPEAESTGSLA